MLRHADPPREEAFFVPIRQIFGGKKLPSQNRGVCRINLDRKTAELL